MAPKFFYKIDIFRNPSGILGMDLGGHLVTISHVLCSLSLLYQAYCAYDAHPNIFHPPLPLFVEPLRALDI